MSGEIRVGQVWRHRYKPRRLTVAAVEMSHVPDGELYVLPRYDTSGRTQRIAEPTLRRSYVLEREMPACPC